MKREGWGALNGLPLGFELDSGAWVGRVSLLIINKVLVLDCGVILLHLLRRRGCEAGCRVENLEILVKCEESWPGFGVVCGLLVM